MNNKILTNQRGASRYATLFLLAIAAGILYAASEIIPFYYYYHELQGQFHAQARVAYDRSDKEVREYLIRQIDKMEIPIDDNRDLIIRRVGEKIFIELEYEEVFWISFNDKDYRIWEFPFHAKATASKSY